MSTTREVSMLVMGEDHTQHGMICPECSFTWVETTHDLWNVISLRCPGCAVFLGIKVEDFCGDSNAVGDAFDGG